MAGEQRLVGRDHMLAGFEGSLHRRSGRIGLPADQLDEDVDLRRCSEGYRIVNPFDVLKIVDASGFLAVAGGNGHHRHRAAGLHGNGFSVLLQRVKHARADRSEAGEPKSQGIFHMFDHNPLKPVHGASYECRRRPFQPILKGVWPRVRRL
jgi:hypothetical protein